MFIQGQTQLASGSGHWDIGLPAGDAIAIDDPGQEGLFPAIQMTIDLTSLNVATVSFTGPVAPTPPDSIGFTATVDLKIVNDTGTSLPGLDLDLNMLDPKLPLSIVPGVIQFGNSVNANYAFFTGIQPGSFAGETETLISPDGLVTSPTGNAASQIELAGTIAAGASVEGNFTIHNTELDTGNNNFTMTIGEPATNGNFAVSDQTTGQTYTAAGTLYKGPVAGLQDEVVMLTSHNINVGAMRPSFIHTGSGDDAINASGAGGGCVLDGSTGSNFLVGGSTGQDTFYVDDRQPTADIWSTILNFHSGDDATIWGLTPTDFNIQTVDNQGATGATGLTYHVTAAGKPTASVTLAGFTTADLTNGRLSVSFGKTEDLPGLPGSSFMLIHGT